MAQLSTGFMMELFASIMGSQKIMEVCYDHLEFNYLPGDDYKRTWKTIKTHYQSTKRVPSFGVIFEINKNVQDVTELIAKIQETDRPEETDTLDLLEKFIKDSKFVALYDEMADLFERGQKDLAVAKMAKGSEEIQLFSIKGKYYTKIFGEHKKRQNKRQLDRMSGKLEALYIPTLIPEIDAKIRGIKKKQTLLLMGQSGAGKSYNLRYFAVVAAVMGFKVLFVSAEDATEEVTDLIDQAWMNVTKDDLYADMPEEVRRKLEKSAKNIIQGGGEIHVKCFEQFGSAKMSNIMQAEKDVSILDNRPVDFVVIDYLDEIEPVGFYPKGDKWERRFAVANEMKNFAMDRNIALATATQGSTVAPELLNDPSFVQTRYNIAQIKALIRPFSYFFTLNVTDEEMEMGIMRLHFDKLRFTKGGKTFIIGTNFDKGQFFSPQKTIKLNSEEEFSKEKKSTPKRRRNKFKSNAKEN